MDDMRRPLMVLTGIAGGGLVTAIVKSDIADFEVTIWP